MILSASSKEHPRLPARTRVMCVPPVGSSAVKITFPSLRMLIPVVPPPTSTTAPSVMPRTAAAAVGSSITLITSSPTDSTTLEITFTFPEIIPGGTAVAAS